MHRPVLTKFTLIAALVVGPTLTAAEQPTLSSRLTKLRQSWSGEDQTQQPVQRTAHTEPAKRGIAGDLFHMLGGGKPKEAPAPRLASRPTDNMPAAPKQRAGSVLSKPAAKPAASYDIFDALGSKPAEPTLAPERPEEPAKLASRPTGAPRRHSTGDVALDLIGTTARSSDTTGVGRPEDQTAPLVTNSLDELDEIPVTETPITPIPGDPADPPADAGFASAADAAKLASLPQTTLPEPTAMQAEPTIEVESPSIEKAIEPAAPIEDAAPVTANNNSDALTLDWSSAPEGPLERQTPQPTPSAPVQQEPVTEVTSSPSAERAFGSDAATATVSDRVGQEQDVWISTPSNSASAFASNNTSDNLLVTEQLPQIISRVSGPKTILIDREAKYQVTIENRGNAAADQLSTEVVAPAWADVVHVTASAGAVQRPANQAGGTTLRWDISSLQAGRSQTLDVVLVPKTSQPLSLGVSWRHAPVAATTMVEVQEPKLAMAISGPNEVFFGRPQTYRLSINNPGTGPAENIVVQLMPPGGSQPVSSYRIDRLGAGEAKSVDIEITARDPGELAITAVAAADGNLRTETSQQIFCRQAELNVDWRGPERKYAGTEATYYFRVRNPGTASADQVTFDVNLPAGFEFRAASDGHQFDAASQRVIWKIGTLRPGDDCYLELRGIVNQAGPNEFRFAAVNHEGDVRDSMTASTQVVALADLKLDVTDPKGPVPVGADVVYDITVTNRGRSTAEEVNIIGLFSEGIEPLAAEGAEATIADGRVGFHTISSLPAGQQVKLKIRARAQSAGTHLFRAEVLCRDLEIKLAAEETTRFFQDESTAANGGAPLNSASRAARFE
ncbi:CARDB domain-containing protein [Aeoliella sp.]|uniref:CARDB domain-containing protein n=1 Tax=Aeoliella sp. TaxID=2795800 RepID=UPI003CCB7D42